VFAEKEGESERVRERAGEGGGEEAPGGEGRMRSAPAINSLWPSVWEMTTVELSNVFITSLLQTKVPTSIIVQSFLPLRLNAFNYPLPFRKSVCVSVCMCVCVYVCVWVGGWVGDCARACACVHACACVCASVRAKEVERTKRERNHDSFV